jgi:hypothetical protein
MKKITIQLIIAVASIICINSSAQQTVAVKINSAAAKKFISPYIYGKNNSLHDNNTSGLSSGLTDAQWQRLRDMGITMFRDNGGNNSTKYNWRKKLSSHPDWYNNVYAHDWDFVAQGLQQKIPSAQGMWTFQLIGKAAKTGAVNFNDWNYNSSQWWEGCGQNLCGGGTVNSTGGSEALADGDTALYLEKWNADSTTGILDHWFGSGGIGLNREKLLYWNMDNEPEIWNGTHDDVCPIQPDAETFMQNYFAVAKKARAKFPNIKLMGPIPANEWQWYNWNGNKISYKSKEYVWLEYFILRIAEEQQASGVRLLDVLDIHFYPGEKSPSDIVQLHRVYFDETYEYPGANGVKRSGSSGWDASINKEYIFKRCNDWLEKYLGADHGITFSVSEISLADRSNPKVNASWYASTLGEFSRQGVEVFTPWDWATGMSEVAHLFTHFGQEYYLNATSSEELFVSAYPTINYNSDTLTVFIVNRHLTESRMVNLDIVDFSIKDGTYKLFTLSNLPSAETFVSHTNNALKTTNVEISGNNISLPLAPLSVSALVLVRNSTYYSRFGERLTAVEAENGILNGVTAADSIPGYSGTGYVTGLDEDDNYIRVSFNSPSSDLYRVVIRYLGTSGKSNQHVAINGSFTATVNFPASDAFTDTDAGGFVLQQGSNTLTISRDSGSAEIDRIDIYKIDTKTYAISPELVDTAATDETKALYDLLKLQFGDRIISGQTHDYYDEVETLTGLSPLLRAGDFQSYTNGYSYLWDNNIQDHTFGKLDNGTVSELINWYNTTGRKGIVSLHWHWHSPTGGQAGTNTFYTDFTDFDITRAVTPGTPEYDSIISDIDEIGFQLKRFQDAGVPILWRPLHEAGGGWFWWGAKGPEACLELYNILFDRLKNHHQLHNLIWVWSSPEPEWYPGNDKVDIIGQDSYPGNFNYDNQKPAFDMLYMLTRGEKLIAMTENGPIPDPEACLEQGAPWLYFMSWNNLVTEQNAVAHIKEVYNTAEVLKVESTNFKTNNEWRSSLYPENWKPGYKDAQGRFLHDFSYAGYHMGVAEIPHITKNVIDVTAPPYLADNTGSIEVTQIIQQALNDAGSAGGGVVYLPAGTYRISAADNSSYCLRIAYDSTILRGAGPNLTFLINEQTNMRYKDIIQVKGDDASWFEPIGNATSISFDIPELTHVIPVESVSGFQVGDEVILASTPTPEFIEEHKMTGYWTPSVIKGVAFFRKIDSIDITNNLLFIDSPTRYFLKTRDHARVYHVGKHISECGIEDLSIGNRQNTNTGWEEESYALSGTGAYEVHNSHAIQFKNAENCWLKAVRTFKPAGNTEDYHLLSNGLKLNQSRYITIEACSFEKSQYEGGGGNGYMYTLESNDCLVRNCIANHGRHNYDFKYPYSNGNVILLSRGEYSKYASDFHMYLSMSNLFDACTFNSDFLESAFRPYGSNNVLHGYTSTQSVFYNTTGEAYHPDKNYLIDSRQFGWGYIIGTSGPACEVEIDPAEGSLSGYLYNTTPRDFTEGIGEGTDLRPASLYLDQLYRRLNDTASSKGFQVEILIRDAETKQVIPGSSIKVFNNILLTNDAGIAVFNTVPEYFQVNVGKACYAAIEKKSFLIYSDTTLTLYLTKEKYDLTIRLLRAGTLEPITGTTVTFNAINQVTNNLGEVNYSVYGGYHILEINKPNFQPVYDSIPVDGYAVVVINLVQTHANVKIRLKEGSAPVNLATVIVHEDTLITGSLGMATFNHFPVSTWYTYAVKKNGYKEKQSTLYLTRDTIIDVSMEKGTAITLHESDLKTECWPNPANDLLYIRLGGAFFGKIMLITDLKGVEVFRQKIERNNFAIDIRDLSPGTYFLQTIDGERQNSQYFIKR